MPRVNIGALELNYLEHGAGDNVVLAIHGNLGCADWLNLVLPLLPDSLHVIAVEWRGCGDSDKPAPAADYSNYSMRTHAADMLALLSAHGFVGAQRAHPNIGHNQSRMMFVAKSGVA